ncbi:hypothetical protein AAZV13_18G044200 [Glycine max]
MPLNPDEEAKKLGQFFFVQIDHHVEAATLAEFHWLCGTVVAVVCVCGDILNIQTEFQFQPCCLHCSSFYLDLYSSSYPIFLIMSFYLVLLFFFIFFFFLKGNSLKNLFCLRLASNLRS